MPCSKIPPAVRKRYLNELRALRKEAGIRPVAIHRLTGISEQYLSRLHAGNMTPGKNVLVRYAAAVSILEPPSPWREVG